MKKKKIKKCLFKQMIKNNQIINQKMAIIKVV